MIKKTTFALICSGVIVIGGLYLTGCAPSNDTYDGLQKENAQYYNQSTPATKLVKKKGSKTAYYPQISEFKGELLKDYMNQSLKKVFKKYSQNKNFSNLVLDYEIKRNDEKIISVLFEGTVDINGFGTGNIKESINLDVGDSTNEITYDNLVKDTATLKEKLNDVALQKGLKEGFDAEGVRVYFTQDNIVFFYMRLDDTAKDFTELVVPEKDIKDLLNTDFGDKPAS